MMAAHSKISYLPETSFFRRYVSTNSLGRLYKKNGKRSVVDTLNADPHFLRLGLDANRIVDASMNTGDTLDLAIYMRILRSFVREETYFVGDKDPRMIEYLPLLAASFSRCVVVNIVRDPRDVIMSKKKADWSAGRHVWAYVFANRVQMKSAVWYGERRFGRRYLEIVYEDLIAKPEGTLRRICAAVGLDFEYSMLAFGNAAEKLVADNEIAWKRETLGPLLASNKNKWREGLPRREVRLTELCCKDAFKTGNYTSETRTLDLGLSDRLGGFTGYCIVVAATYPYLLLRFFRLSHRWKNPAKF